MKDHATNRGENTSTVLAKQFAHTCKKRGENRTSTLSKQSEPPAFRRTEVRCNAYFVRRLRLESLRKVRPDAC